MTANVERAISSRAMTRWSVGAASALVLLAACTSDAPGNGGTVGFPDPGRQTGDPDSGSSTPTDTGVTAPDAAGGLDAGGTPIDAGSPSDAGMAGGPDAGPATDAGGGGALELAPGSHIVTGRGRVALRDTRTTVERVLGPGVRTNDMNARSYDWDLGGGVRLTAWFANTGLDASPANNVEANDEVLWLAVTGPFAGQTADGLGIGSNKQAVERVYGAALRSTPITDPAGTIEPYYTDGLLVAYDTQSQVRTMTICRRYARNPDGQIRLADGRLRWSGPGGAELIGGFLGASDDGDVLRILGNPPDAVGRAQFGGTTLDVMSYGFIGLEIFLGQDRVVFITLHAPYFGTANTSPTPLGLGVSKTDFESGLAASNFGAGTPSSQNASVTCYQSRNTSRWIGVTYAGMPGMETVSTISTPLPSDACR